MTVKLLANPSFNSSATEFKASKKVRVFIWNPDEYPDYEHTKLPKEFKDDLIELMNYLVSNECAHPYDNLVAGGVA